MIELAQVGGHTTGFGATKRLDRWWVSPLAVLCGLLAFILYATWAAFQGNHYYVGPYLSPFYSPVIFTDLSAAGAAPVDHAWFGTWPSWWPSLLPISPALLILIFPGLFRFTCYYYRKAYYRAFAGTPPGCAVGPIPRKNYKGETGMMIFQNLHRYALYPALLYIVILFYDAFLAFSYKGELGVGVGSFVLLINACLLSGYTFGCHSFRHLIGGKLDCYSCSMNAGVRHKAWSKASLLNARHQLFAWGSLFWVGFSDVYVRMVSQGIWTDFNTWSGF